MIRARIISEGEPPGSLLSYLKSSGEIEIDSSSPDVFLIFCPSWNRASFMRIAANSKPVVIVCDQAEEPFTTDSILRGEVFGVLRSNARPSQIISALRAAAERLRVLPEIRNHLVACFPVLTPRELEVLRLIADGEGNKSIADLLQISQHTVKFHISSIFEKLHVSSRTEAVKAGLHRGFISI